MADRVQGLPRALPRAPLYAVEVLIDGRWERAGVPASWESTARGWAERLSRRYERVRVCVVGGPDDPSVGPQAQPRRRDEAALAIEVARSLTDRELSRRGLVRAGLGLRAATDKELDAMWRARRTTDAWRDQPKPATATDANRASLALEFRGHDVWSLVHPRGIRPWVARLVGREREFLRGAVDFLHADELGGEGVYLWYVLDAGDTYEIYDRARPAGPRRRIVEVIDGQVETVAVRA